MASSFRSSMIVIAAAIMGCLSAQSAARGEAAVPPAGRYACEEDQIEVIFVKESRVRLEGRGLKDLSGADAVSGVDAVLSRAAWREWSRICSVPVETIDELTAQGEANTGKKLQSPNNMYRVRIGTGADVWDLCASLEALPGVQVARPVPRPMALPTPPDYGPQQGYLRPAAAVPAGIDADYAWTRPGGDGSGIGVCDLEYSWNWFHYENRASSEIHIYFQDPQNDPNHGTAVLGVMQSHDNGWGTKGICHGASFFTCATYYKTLPSDPYSWNVPGAIVDAASSGWFPAGSVLLIEHQWNLPGRGFVPIEWWTDSTPNQTENGVYNSIQWVLAIKRMHVVEAAGNGNVNLDGLNWFGDSGAIIVGAGGAYAGGTYPEGNLQRLSFSSYGARVDLQGWGENVVTTGYGYLYNAEGVDYRYTDRFDGTSSASPIVAGAVACCSGYHKANISSRFPLHPAYIRDVLKETGTPQVTPPAGNIGPRPNLRAAFARLDEWVDITAAPINSTGGSPSWADYDGDGDLDLFVARFRPAGNSLYRNDGAGVFADVTPEILRQSSLDNYGGVWGDYDNDGDLDLYLPNYNSGCSRLFRNDGAGGFSDVTSGPLFCQGVGPSPTWVDYDNDGDIDLYLARSTAANRLLRNDGGGVFTDVTSGPEGYNGYTTRAACIDYDNDGDIDIYLNIWNAANKLLRNDGGAFVDVSSAPLNIVEGTSSCWGDYDNDGDLDVYLVIGTWGVPNRLFRNDGGGTFVDVTAAPINDTQHCVEAAWLDVENDGDLDLYLVNSGDRSRLFLNDGAGNFTDKTPGLLIWEGYNWTKFSRADCDNDGDLDPYFTHYSPANCNTLLRNASTGSNHWLQVRLIGRSSNRAGIGARVKVVTGRGQQVRYVTSDQMEQDLIVTFGLGSQTAVSALEIEWPGGDTQQITGVAADQRLVVIEGLDPAPVAGPLLVPAITRLHPAAPNPLRGPAPTVIRYDLAATAPVRLVLFDLSGRVLRVLRERSELGPGSFSSAWDGRDDQGHPAAPGIYFYRLDAGAYRDSGRVVKLE